MPSSISILRLQLLVAISCCLNVSLHAAEPWPQLRAMSRDLNAPLTLNSKIGDPAKKTVLIYYANENAPDKAGMKNYQQAIKWLRDSKTPKAAKTAASLERDLKEFPAAVRKEIASIKRNSLNAKLDKLSIVLFTNHWARQGTFRVLHAGSKSMDTAKFDMPKMETQVLRTSPLASTVGFRTALNAAADLFDADAHQFILVTKSHGNEKIAMTPRLQFEVLRLQKEQFLALANIGEIETSGVLVKDDGTPMLKESLLKTDALSRIGDLNTRDNEDLNQDTPAILPGVLTDAAGKQILDSTGKTIPTAGMLKQQYIQILRDAGTERNMQFPLLFIESCRSQLDQVALQRLKDPYGNIGRLYTSGLTGLKYTTLDYDQLFKLAGTTDTFTDAVHQTLFATYKKQQAECQQESIGKIEGASRAANLGNPQRATPGGEPIGYIIRDANGKLQVVIPLDQLRPSR